MKKSLIFTALAAAAMLVSCNKPEQNPGERLVHFTLRADASQTKTSLYDMDNGSYQPLWQEGDELGVFFSDVAPTKTEDLKKDAILEASVENDGLTAVFTGTAQVADNEAQTIFAFYPASAGKKRYSSGLIGLDILGTQHPDFVRSNYSFDPASDLLVAKPHTCFVLDGEAVSNENMLFTRVSSVVKFNLNAESTCKAYGQVVENLKLTVSGADIAGRVCYDPSTCEVRDVISIANSNVITLIPTEDCYTYVGYEGGNVMFASVAPVTVAQNALVKVEIETTDYTITKTLETHPEFAFPAGQIFVLNLSVTDAECEQKISGGGEGLPEASFTWNLAVDQTKTASATELTWEKDGIASMSVEKGASTTATNNYYPGTAGKTYTSTRFYTSSVLTITPEEDVFVRSVEFAATSSGYATALANSVWTNASAKVDTENNMKVVVTPKNSAAAISATIGANCGFTGVTVNYASENIPTTVPVTGVALSQSSATLEVGETLILTATVSPDNASDKSVAWASDNTAVANVTNGIVTAVGAGTANITVTTVDGDKTATCVVTVNPEPVVETTIADALTKADDGKVYQVTGTASNITNTTYGNFTLVDGGASIEIYGLLTADGEAKQFASLDIAEGDQVTLKGKVITYNSTIEIKNAVFVSRVKSTTPDQPTETPVYASLADLVAAGEPTEAGSTVTVTLTDEVIKSFATSGSYRNGIYLNVGDTTVEVYCKDVPAEWAVNGTVSATLTDCVWKNYRGTWELCPENWNAFTYTAPEPIGGGDDGDDDATTYTALFGSAYNSAGVGSYSNEWSTTNDGFTCNMVNWNNNNNSWSYAKAGSKSAPMTATITTAAAIPEAISSVTMTIDAITAANVNSITLNVLSGSTVLESISGSKKVGDCVFSIANPTANCTYEIVVDCAKGSSNGLITVSKVVYSAE